MEPRLGFWRPLVGLQCRQLSFRVGAFDEWPVTIATPEVALVKATVAPLSLAFPLTLSLIPQETQRLILVIPVTTTFGQVEALCRILLLPVVPFGTLALALPSLSHEILIES